MVRELIVAKDLQQAYDLSANNGFFYIAGGSEINRLNSSVRCSKAVSIQNLHLDGIERKYDQRGGKKDILKIQIGALSTFSQCLNSNLIPDDLKCVLKFNSSLQKRNMATIGGNIASLRDDSYLIPCLVAYNSDLRIYKQNKLIPISLYLSGKRRFDLIEYIILSPKRKVLSYRLANTQASHSYINVSVGCNIENGKCINPIVCAAVKGYGIFRLTSVESAIELEEKIDAEYLRQIVMKMRINFKDSKIYGSGAFLKYELASCVYLLIEELIKILD